MSKTWEDTCISHDVNLSAMLCALQATARHYPEAFDRATEIWAISLDRYHGDVLARVVCRAWFE